MIIDNELETRFGTALFFFAISSSCNRYSLLLVKVHYYVSRAAWCCMVVKDSGRILFFESPILFLLLSLSLSLYPSGDIPECFTILDLVTFRDSSF